MVLYCKLLTCSVDAHNWYRRIQEALILNNMNALLTEILSHHQPYILLVENNNLARHVFGKTAPIDVVRCVVHIILALRGVEMAPQDDLANDVISLYVDALILSDKQQMVALYASKLPYEIQVAKYAELLQRAFDHPHA
jgi:hypothetical protein